MTLDILQKEMITAMKTHNKPRKDTISSLIAAIKKAAIDEMCKDNISEELVNKIILKEQKIVQEMIEKCPASRADLLSEYNERLTIINEFAPTLITDEVQIKSIICNAAAEKNIELIKPNRGLVMKEIAIPCLKGKADMAIVNKVVSELLQ